MPELDKKNLILWVAVDNSMYKDFQLTLIRCEEKNLLQTTCQISASRTFCLL